MNEAKSRCANIHHFDFNKYDKLTQLFASIDNVNFFNAIGSIASPTLVILENADAFSNSNCQEAFTLRACLESKMNRLLIRILLAKTVSIDHIFLDQTAPFYLSSCPLMADV